MAIFAGCIVLFSSLVNLYEKRKLILKQIIFTSSLNNENIKYDEVQDKDRKWFAQSKYDETIAKDIPNGGYILFVRHAHREKWIDVTMYDAYETLVNVKAENTYFDKAVCLSSRGKVQAKMMGEFIRKVKNYEK